jgi:hypothetical protein
LLVGSILALGLIILETENILLRSVSVGCFYMKE